LAQVSCQVRPHSPPLPPACPGKHTAGAAMAAFRSAIPGFSLRSHTHLGSAGNGCASLPAWPTLAELKNAGFVLDVSLAEVAVGQVLAVCGGLVFLPQAVKIAARRSVRGASLLMVLTSMLATCMQLGAITFDASPTFLACRDLPFGQCFANTLAFQQMVWQAIGTTGVFLTFYAFWSSRKPPAERLNGRRRRLCFPARATAGICFIVAMSAPAACGLLPLCFGPCSPALLPLRDVTVVCASVLQVLVMLPQIRLLCSTHNVGSLSLVSVGAQGLGSFIFFADMLLEGQRFASTLPFFIVGLECTVVVALAAAYRCRGALRTPRSSADLLDGAGTPSSWT